MTEHESRTRKARAIADALQAVGCDATTAGRLADHVWQLAATTAWQLARENGADVPAKPWTDASAMTRSAVCAVLADRERTDTPKSLGAAVGGLHVLGEMITALVAVPQSSAELASGSGPVASDEGDPDDEDAFLNWCENAGIDPGHPDAWDRYLVYLDAVEQRERSEWGR